MPIVSPIRCRERMCTRNPPIRNRVDYDAIPAEELDEFMSDCARKDYYCSDEFECPICMEEKNVDDAIECDVCGNAWCTECNQRMRRCPICRTYMNERSPPFYFFLRS